MSDEARHVRGKSGSLPARKRPYRLHEIKRWFETEQSAGRPGSLENFYDAHDVCSACHGEGVRMIGWSDPVGADELRAAQALNLEQLPVYDVCDRYHGTGNQGGRQGYRTYQSSKSVHDGEAKICLSLRPAG